MTITKTIARDLPDGGYLEVTAELRDDSGTLSPGFCLTGSLWERYGTRSGRVRARNGADIDAGGQLVETMLTAYPELTPFARVHLAAPDGTPMHATANGWYFYSGGAAAYERSQIARGRDYGYSRMLERSDAQRAADYLRIDVADLPTGITTRWAFDRFAETLADRWAQDAATAVAILDALVDGDGVEVRI